LPNCLHNVYVDIVGKGKLQDFWEKHTRAKKPLERWIQIIEEAKWNKFADVKQTFRSARWLPPQSGKFVLFNVKGNRYRVVTAINFRGQVVVILVVMTHSEYDKGKWKEKL